MNGTVDRQDATTLHSPMLQATGLERRADDRVLLERVSVAIHDGDRTAILGPTGSGKTLLLRSLAMLDPVDGGEIRWLGRILRGSEIPQFRSRVIYVHQRPALAEGSVEDNLRQPFALRVHHDKQFARNRIINLLTSLGRGESFLSKRQRDLSGGEAQLAALLRAIQLDPLILLLDEPTAALDADAADMVETLVATWLSEGSGQRAMVWVTHDRAQARRISTAVLQMHEGRLS